MTKTKAAPPDPKDEPVPVGDPPPEEPAPEETAPPVQRSALDDPAHPLHHLRNA